MIIDCISDLHGHRPMLEGGDLLIIAGDMTASNIIKAWDNFFCWLVDVPYDQIIYIGGNHDGVLEESISSEEGRKLSQTTRRSRTGEYLCDNGYEYKGIKIWGSPYTPTYGNWSFMEERGEAIKKHWDLIPDDTQIVITHGPPHRILDQVDGENAGCEELAERIKKLTNLKYHVFGHVHEAFGVYNRKGVTYLNCSYVNERYEPVNYPLRIVWES